MATRSIRAQVLIAVGCLGLLLLALRMQAGLGSPGDVPAAQALWQVRGALGVFALVGAGTALFALWGVRNRVGAGTVAAVLTVVVLTAPTGFAVVTADWLSSVWARLWIQSSAVLPVAVWGAAVATWLAATLTAGRSNRT